MPFRDLTGHRRLVDLLARSIQRGSLPPSLIFAGPSGVGKRAMAMAVAQAVNCLQPRDTWQLATGESVADACGTCTACTRIARGVHPDILVVEPGETGTIKIEQVRDVVDRAAYRPFEGRLRVVIVDEADALQIAAQNALLKTLEEPPSASMFILVTARPDVLLPTVRSRCIRLWFAAGSAGEADDEARDVAERVLAHAAGTSDARRRLEGAKDLLAKGNPGATDREQLVVHLRAMSSLLRDLVLAGAQAGDGSAGTGAVARGLTAAYQGERGVQAFAAVDRALLALDRNAGVKIVADWVLLQL